MVRQHSAALICGLRVLFALTFAADWKPSGIFGCAAKWIEVNRHQRARPDRQLGISSAVLLDGVSLNFERGIMSKIPENG